MEQQGNVLFDYGLIVAMVLLCLAPFMLIIYLLFKRPETMPDTQTKHYKVKASIDHQDGSNGWLCCDEQTFNKIKDYLFSSNTSFIVKEYEKQLDSKNDIN